MSKKQKPKQLKKIKQKQKENTEREILKQKAVGAKQRMYLL